MRDWNDMTPDERRDGVLTKVCGWTVREHMTNPLYDIFTRPDGKEYQPINGLPPILTSADAAIEHVVPAIKDKGYVWTYKSETSTVILHRKGFIYASIFIGHGDLAPALCEAAYRMATEGEEG